MVPSICLLRNSTSCWMHGIDHRYMQICMNLLLLCHDHLIFAFESHRPNGQLFYPIYYRPGLIDTPYPRYSLCWLWRMLCFLWRMLCISRTSLCSFVSMFSDDISSHRILLHCEGIFEGFFQCCIAFYCKYWIYFSPLLLFSTHLYLCRIVAYA